jgi:hypothetical protein
MQMEKITEGLLGVSEPMFSDCTWKLWLKHGITGKITRKTRVGGELTSLLYRPHHLSRTTLHHIEPYETT